MDRQRVIPSDTGINKRMFTLIICFILLALIVCVFLSGSFITEEAISPDFTKKNLPPSLQYPFGTDWMGRNMLFRTVKGLSISIVMGVLASTVSVVLATLIGTMAAIAPKWVDHIICWFIDLVMGIPHLVLLILISFAFGQGWTGLFVSISVTHWMGLSRVIRGEVLQIRYEPYIIISRKLGHSSFWILKNHILVHVLPQFVVGFVLLFPHAILHESALSFLGYGLPPEQPAIGIILSESMRYLTSGMWWLAFFPGVALVILVLLFDKLGNNIKFLFNPNRAQD